MTRQGNAITAIYTIVLLFSCAISNLVHAQLSLNQPHTLELKNGMRFNGRLGGLDEMGPTKAGLSPDSNGFRIVLIDDGIREIFVPRFSVANKAPIDVIEEEFEIWQKVHRGDGLGTVIGSYSTGPFDKFGRRMVRLDTVNGRQTVFQGITKINPRYVRLQGLVNSIGENAKWDMRLSVNSVPTSVLVKVLERQIKNVNDPNERLRLAQFYVQAGFYKEAERAYREIGRSFPGLKEELKDAVENLNTQVHRQVLQEAELRFKSGQPILASQFIQPLENSIGIASTVLVEIGELKKRIEEAPKRIAAVKAELKGVLKRVVEDVNTGPEVKQVMESFSAEIDSELNANNIDRLATFERLSGDPSQSDVERASVALSGWILGAGGSTETIGESQSLLETRALVIEYLQTGRAERRLAILRRLAELETGIPEFLDLVVKHIKPPLAPSSNELRFNEAMTFEVEIPGPLGTTETVRYLVQLPPEYDPYRRYPAVMTLGGGTFDSTPEAQINWWAGAISPRFGIRKGLASRHGYIVISPDWMKPSQATYNYSARTSAAVLGTLRHALRRFSIDTDRVFLSGHYAGANAAWDIGQSHPEYWTGVIPISARVGKYINHYHSNGKYHSKWYFINGARDFASKEANSTVWNKRMSKDFDTIVVHYKGRSEERYSDELPNLFLWMEPQRRQFDVRQFECASLRPWDNRFWWLEVDLTNNNKMILPEYDWNSFKNRSRWDIEGEIKEIRPNYYYIRGARDNATIWLSPGIVDFSKNVQIGGENAGKFNDGVRPSRKTLLEDVRTRADRQHPYWAKIVRSRKVWSVEE